MPYLTNLVDSSAPDVLCLQETYLGAHSSLRLAGFHPLASRCERVCSRGGGVAVLVRDTIPQLLLDIQSPLEACGTQIRALNRDIAVCSLYLPPELPLAVISAELPRLLAALPRPFFLATDANAHHPAWGSPASDQRGDFLQQFLTDSDLVLLNQGEPTFLSSRGSYSHIDLTISTPDIAPLFTWSPFTDPHTSDHFPILSSTALPLPSTQVPRWRIRSANWSAFSQQLHLPTDFLSPTQACGAVADALKAAALGAIPQATAVPKRRACVWWTRQCSDARRAKNKALTRYRHHLGNIELWVAFKRARALFRRTIAEARATSWNDFLSSITGRVSSRVLWGKVCALSRGTTPRTVALRDGAAAVTDPGLVANMLATHFARQSSGFSSDPLFVARRDRTACPGPLPDPDTTPAYNRPFTQRELQRALRASSSSSPGADSIPFSFLQHLDASQQKQLLRFYNYVYATGFPHQWREAVIVPILKPGKPSTAVASYRPIALTNCMCKVVEKMINWRLQTYLERVAFYDPTQSGFRAGHSTLDGLTRLESSVRETFLRGSYCLAVFLDIARAFDTVWHTGILLKLREVGLGGNLVRFIAEFLRLRSIRVRVGGVLSESRPISSGVPQGSVISPTLFTVFINDLFAAVPAGVHTSLFADDGALWVCHPSLEEATAQMRLALRRVEEWSHRWGLTFSAPKTSAVLFTRRRTPPAPLEFFGSPVNFVSSVRFLGVIFDRGLTWGPHISHVVSRCTSDLRLLSVVAARRWGADSLSLRRLYLALIRPKLDYASFLFSPAAPSHLLRLDRIQFAAARVILGALRCTPTSKLEAEANLLPLSYRRCFLLSSYCARVLTIPRHPVRLLLLQYYPFAFYAYLARPVPVPGRALALYREMGLRFDSIPTISMTSRYSPPSAPVLSSLAFSPKSSLSAPHWRQLFYDLLLSYSPRIPVYTDGSAMAGAVGCGVYSPLFSLKARLPSGSSVFTAELYALYAAVKYLARVEGSFVLFTDSMACISALRSLDAPSHYLVPWLFEAIAALPLAKLIVEWVPGHVGIPGNEVADTLAKSSLTLPSITNITLPSPDLRSFLLRHFRSRWQLDWSAAPPCITSFKQLLGPSTPLDLSRPDQVVISRLRLGVCALTHGHYFTHSPPPTCHTCTTRFTLPHLFFHCPTHAVARAPLLAFCRQHSLPLTLDSLFNHPIPYDIVLCFLSVTGFLHSI